VNLSFNRSRDDHQSANIDHSRVGGIAVGFDSRDVPADDADVSPTQTDRGYNNPSAQEEVEDRYLAPNVRASDREAPQP